MQELLRIKTEDFLLLIRTRAVKEKQQALRNTLQQRGLSAPTHELLFSPAIKLQEPVRLQGREIRSEHRKGSTVLLLPEPLFFENTQYVFSWHFFKPVEHASIAHKTKHIADSFSFITAEENLGSILFGQLNTRNDVGWLSLPLVYEFQGLRFESVLAFEVLPTKMLLEQDLQAMYRNLDEWLPLWRFSFLATTAQTASKGPRRGDFLLMWLANFEQMRQRFEHGLKIILHSPHKKVQTQKGRLPASRLTGRISPKLAEQIKEDIASKRFNQKYPSTIKTLTADTPENRFIKSVVVWVLKRLQLLETKLRGSDLVNEQPKFSEAFIEQVQYWQRPLEKALNSSFLKELKPQLDVDLGSLVLQQKPGYSALFHAWNELKYYLEYFARQTHISMKSVAEIYEIWCFLTIKKLLIQDLGFEERTTTVRNALYRGHFELGLTDGMAGAFELKRADGVRARLAHEPLFKKDGHPIRSYLLPQKPDIVLEVTVPINNNPAKQQRFFWVFDAKYRIKAEATPPGSSIALDMDLVPDDAINQMHRYRDALIYTVKGGRQDSKNTEQMSRAIIGAFALYPGFFDQPNTPNPYDQAIESVGVGAFALLPSVTSSGSGHYWLSKFLESQIGTLSNTGQKNGRGGDLSERLYTQTTARIPLMGMEQILYTELAMTVSLAPADSRDEHSPYLQTFIDGTASWYHLPVSTFNRKFKYQYVVEEIRFLAIALRPDPLSQKSIEMIWPVISVNLKSRREITAKQSGRSHFNNPDELYYLFQLGRPLRLAQRITNIPASFMASIKLSTLTDLSTRQDFADIESVYQELLAD